MQLLFANNGNERVTQRRVCTTASFSDAELTKRDLTVCNVLRRGLSWLLELRRRRRAAAALTLT